MNKTFVNLVKKKTEAYVRVRKITTDRGFGEYKAGKRTIRRAKRL